MLALPQRSSAARRASNHIFFRDLEPTLNIAHRGGAELYPENTMLAFETAIQVHGAHMIETDVHLTADGEVAVFHDHTLDRTTNGTGEIAHYTWAELRRLDAGYRYADSKTSAPIYRERGLKIPSLSEVLHAFPNVRFNLDLKSSNPALVRACADTIKAHDATERVCVGSEFDGIAELLVVALPEAIHFFPRAALIQCMMALMSGAPAVEGVPYKVLDIPMAYAGVNLVAPHILQRAEAAGLWVNVWTVDDEATMRNLIEARIGGIMTDRPDRLARALLRERPPVT